MPKKYVFFENILKYLFLAGDEPSGFDKIWTVLPHISIYQARIAGMAGYVAFIAGFMGIYPVFAQYKPPTRCETVFDKNFTDYNLTWNQIHELTSNTPECVGYSSDDSTECYYCNFQSLSDCGKTYEELEQEIFQKGKNPRKNLAIFF